MASSYSTSLLVPSFPMKIVPYVPRAPKPRPKSKAKPIATTKTAEHSPPGVDSSKDDGEWFHIDDFPMPSSKSYSLDPAVPGVGVAGGLGAASESGKPEHCQSGQKSLDGGGRDHATSIATNPALNGLFDGSSLEHPLILESDAAEEYHGTTQVKPSNRALGTEGYRAGQDGKGMDGIGHEVPSPVEDEPLFDVGMTSRSPLIRKRTRRSSGDTIISSTEVSDITSEPELEDPRLAKRQRPSEREAGNLILDHVPTPKPTSLPTPSSPDPRSRISNEPSPDHLDNGSQGGDPGSSDPSPNNLDEENGDGAHAQGIVEGLLPSPRQSISPFEGVERGKNRKRSYDEAGGSRQGCTNSSPETQAGGGINDCGHSANVAYQITDLTHCHVPEGSSIVTAIMRCSESSLPLNPIALGNKLLGREGKVIRMLQLSPDSWMLLGYRYDDGVLGACNREGLTLRNADRTSTPLSDNTDHPDDEDEEDGEGSGEYRPRGAGSGRRLGRDDMRSHKRTHVPWLKSDELRLLAYKKDMDMEWKDIFDLFPGRTSGAVRTRWHMLQGKRSVDTTDLLGLPSTNTDAVAPRDDGWSSESSSDDDDDEHLSNNGEPSSSTACEAPRSSANLETSRQGKKAKSRTSTERPQKRLRTRNSLQTRPRKRGKKQKRLPEDEFSSSRASPEPSSKQVRTSATQFRRRSTRLRLRSGGNRGSTPSLAGHRE